MFPKCSLDVPNIATLKKQTANIPRILLAAWVVENLNLCNSPCEKLAGVAFDSKLTFDAHINDTCKKAALKLN